MFVNPRTCLLPWLCLMLATALPLSAQSEDAGKGIEIDFLASYYDQDGDNSPVTGGRGSEELQSISPVFLVKYTTRSGWDLSGSLGADNITSASTDNIDLDRNGVNISSASRVDNRVFATFAGSKAFGNQTWGGNLGFSKEYDYRSLSGGFNWSLDLNGKNDTLGLALNRYQDEVELYDIDGQVEGTSDRETTDLSLSWSHVFSPKTVGIVELSISDQSGWLSSPFQEVILNTGERVQERLPDARTRTALRFSVNHAFTPGVVLRGYARYYDDDWDITATTIELEPHFRLPGTRPRWIYPILRWHSQDGSNYFGLPETFTPGTEYYTADRDLSTFDSIKFGLGYQTPLNGSRIKRFQARATYYDRDDGLTAFNLSFGFGFNM
ncbi:DUF3570 domain-containing protein [Sulfidibacter corallicola]|uniref:DUF3570 domain-containing protein n=1 Tax=Sulfidibacter corallicola TaxID=2818388 RepID=A0A8A4TP95_SULCO|nr:DUF3570 domain-containing protein [Sulfidibacter corallicola]QTD51370.1 DUF3570 domain-containing protein [Sulfidibacter corallicola]